MKKEYQVAVGNYIYIAVKIGDRIKLKNKIKKTVIQDKSKTDLS